MEQTADLVVIGGGVVGLALARSWLLREPQARVVVLDKERARRPRVRTQQRGPSCRLLLRA